VSEPVKNNSYATFYIADQVLRSLADDAAVDIASLQRKAQLIREKSWAAGYLSEDLVTVGDRVHAGGLTEGESADAAVEKLNAQSEKVKQIAILIGNGHKAFESARLAHQQAADDHETIRIWYNFNKARHVETKKRDPFWWAHLAAYNRWEVVIANAAIRESTFVSDELSRNLARAAEAFSVTTETWVQEGEFSPQAGRDHQRELEKTRAIIPLGGKNEEESLSYPQEMPEEDPQSRLREEYPQLFDDHGDPRSLAPKGVGVAHVSQVTEWQLSKRNPFVYVGGEIVGVNLETVVATAFGQGESTPSKVASYHRIATQVAYEGGLQGRYGQVPTNIAYAGIPIPLDNSINVNGNDRGQELLDRQDPYEGPALPNVANQNNRAFIPTVSIENEYQNSAKFSVTGVFNPTLTGSTPGIVNAKYNLLTNGDSGLVFTAGFNMQEQPNSAQRITGINGGIESHGVSVGVDSQQSSFDGLVLVSPTTVTHDLKPLTSSEIDQLVLERREKLPRLTDLQDNSVKTSP
jgi:hypothetical protein